MKNHIIYLITDSNRAFIEIGYCTDLAHKLADIHQTGQTFAHASRLNRIIYMEQFSSSEDAEKRRSELSKYTRMMTERLIRKQNPNWLNIANVTNVKNQTTIPRNMTH